MKETKTRRAWNATCGIVQGAVLGVGVAFLAILSTISFAVQQGAKISTIDISIMIASTSKQYFWILLFWSYFVVLLIKLIVWARDSYCKRKAAA